MPTVPRNTQTETRINPTPGVRSFSPQGADGLGQIAGALGRQASAIGGQAAEDAARTRAIQNVFEGVSDAAMTVDRIDRIREAKAVDEADIAYSGHMADRMTSKQDPKTGQMIPGTLDTPFTPQGPDGKAGTSAEIDTTKAHKEWLENKDGQFARLSPRAQEAFLQRNADKFLAMKLRARDIDGRNAAARNKAVDEAASLANFNAVNMTAGDTDSDSYARSVEAYSTQEAMRVTRAMQADPANADPSKIAWRIPEGPAMFNQAKKEFATKAAEQRVGTLLQMAQAVPVGTPEADARAKQLTDFAQSFAKDSELAPDAIAKAQADAQQVADRRTQRTHALKEADESEASEAALDLVFNPNKSDAMSKYMTAAAKLDPPAQQRLERFAKKSFIADDITRAEDAMAAYAAEAQTDKQAAKEKWDTSVNALVTNEGRLKAQALMTAQQKPAVEAMRATTNALLVSGMKVNKKGQLERVSEEKQFEEAWRLMDAGEISGKDYAAFKKHRTDARKLQEPEIAENVLKGMASFTGLDPVETLKKFKFSSDMNRFEVADEDLAPNEDVTTGSYLSKKTARVKWTDDDGDTEEEELTARLFVEALNATMKYEMQFKTADANKKPPMTRDEYIASLFTVEKNDTLRKLTSTTIRRRISERHDDIGKMADRFMENELMAIKSGTSKRAYANDND
jgi:hypothetical protein